MRLATPPPYIRHLVEWMSATHVSALSTKKPTKQLHHGRHRTIRQTFLQGEGTKTT